jgi:putative sterol carrier protein
MGYFKDANEVYEVIGALFVELLADPELGPRLCRANTIVQYRHTDPDCVLTVRLIDDGGERVDLGETALEPDVVMSMAADTAHRFWQGEVNVPVALARHEMTASGPVAKILKLVPAVKPVFPRYCRLVAERELSTEREVSAPCEPQAA